MITSLKIKSSKRTTQQQFYEELGSFFYDTLKNKLIDVKNIIPDCSNYMSNTTLPLNKLGRDRLLNIIIGKYGMNPGVFLYSRRGEKVFMEVIINENIERVYFEDFYDRIILTQTQLYDVSKICDELSKHFVIKFVGEGDLIQCIPYETYFETMA